MWCDQPSSKLGSMTWTGHRKHPTSNDVDSLMTTTSRTKRAADIVTRAAVAMTEAIVPTMTLGSIAAPGSRIHQCL
jgi:hypothetical protein